MSIFNPTQQIQQIGLQNQQQIGSAFDSILQDKQAKRARTEKLLADVSSIMDEASDMHREWLSEEINTTLNDMADGIFKERKNGNLNIDIKGLEGSQKKIRRLSNLASNSKVFAEAAKDEAERVWRDKYLTEDQKRFVAASIMNTAADKENLMNKRPEQIMSELGTLRTKAWDPELVAQDMLSKLGTEDKSFTINGITTRYSGPQGMVDSNGTINLQKLQGYLGQELSRAGVNVDPDQLGSVTAAAAKTLSTRYMRSEPDPLDEEYKRFKMQQMAEQQRLKNIDFSKVVNALQNPHHADDAVRDNSTLQPAFREAVGLLESNYNVSIEKVREGAKDKLIVTFKNFAGQGPNVKEYDLTSGEVTSGLTELVQDLTKTNPQSVLTFNEKTFDSPTAISQLEKEKSRLESELAKEEKILETDTGLRKTRTKNPLALVSSGKAPLNERGEEQKAKIDQIKADIATLIEKLETQKKFGSDNEQPAPPTGGIKFN